MNGAAHVPAWRRLGLQLKGSGGPNDTISPATHTNPRLPKRSSPEGDSAESTLKSDSNDSHSKKKIKRVAQNITPSTNSTAKPKARDSTSSRSKEPSLGDKSTKPKAGYLREHDTPQSNRTARRYLEYLDEFANSRQTWRFNKSAQNSLLRDVFNVYRIPPRYDAILFEYLDGLQGDSAKVRLQQGAKEILAELHQQDMGQNQHRHRADDEARHRDVEDAGTRDEEIVKSAVKAKALDREENSGEWRMLQLKRSRAEAILSRYVPQASKVVLSEEDALVSLPQDPSVRSNEEPQSKRPRRSRGRTRRLRKEKARTGHFDDDLVDSSSSSATSDNEDPSSVGIDLEHDPGRRLESTSPEDTSDESGSEESSKGGTGDSGDQPKS